MTTATQDRVTFKPQPATGPVLNPGKGWVLYGDISRQHPKTLEWATVGYLRTEWSAVEIGDGEFDWSRIDRHVAGCAALGKQAALAFMALSTHTRREDGCSTPPHVFAAGAKHRVIEVGKLANKQSVPGKKTVPDFADPIFLKHLERFITALAERYDGSPHLAFVDIRSLGNWGEGHMSQFGGELSDDLMKRHAEIHCQAFKHSRLAVSGHKFATLEDWFVEQGICPRRDGICGNSNGSETRHADGRLPGIFELFHDYQWLKDKGWWYGEDPRAEEEGRVPGRNGHRLEDCVETGRPTFIEMSRGGDSALDFLEKERPLVERLTNRMGFHFIVDVVEAPRSFTVGQPAPVHVTIRNAGCTHIYDPAHLTVALLRDGQVVDIAWTEHDLRPIAGDATTSLAATVRFDRAAPGPCELAVGVTRHIGDRAPAIRLANTPAHPAGWTPLGPAELIRP